ncbi:MAG TPA: LuxR C-terminal-related transcriptional regulator, partial [Candidatus Acidoferrum sp.]|nr:LuxR C-terminal-related transcriptional regulator [Candidatus Acidoferrum sp.]
MKKQKALRRDRVNRALESVFDYPLTVIEAPIGYGKTTAVREFLALNNCPVLWLSFLPGEDTASFFWDRLSEEIGKQDEGAGAKLRGLGFPADAPQLATVLSIIGEVDFKQNTVLVLDDFHLSKDPAIGAFIIQIAKEQPDNLGVLIVTRDTSTLDITELLAKGLCNILPQQILRFTDDEVRAYSVLMGYRLTDSELKQLCAYTDGWISMVYLTLLGLGQGIPVGRQDAVSDLIEKALYNAYDADIRRFLLWLSAMDTFTAQQAAFVTQEARAEEFLKKLRLENAFIVKDEATGVYKIHSVLLDFLRAMQKDEGEKKALWRRLGEWHLSRGARLPAYGDFCRAGDVERLLSLLNDPESIAYNSTYFEGFLELFKSIPHETLIRHPFAYLQFIDTLLTDGDPADAQDGAARLNEFEAAIAGAPDMAPDFKNRILGEIHTTRIFTVFNDPKRMVAHTQEALRLLDGGVSYIMMQQNEFTFGSPHFLYTYYREQGALKQTAQYMAAEFPCFPRLASGCGTGCDYLTMAEYALETGDWHEAELNARKTIVKAKTKGQTGIIICACFTLMRLFIRLGKTAEALTLLRRLRDAVARENSVFYNTSMELVEGYIYACLGRPESIPEWISSGDMSPAHFMYEGIAFNYIVHGKAVLLSRDYVRLEMLTEEFASYFSVFHNQLGFLHNKIFEAVAKYWLYGMEKGLAALNDALDMAREDHIVLPFAEYGPDLLDMMREIDYAHPGDAYVKEVFAACEAYSQNLKNAPQSALSLSPREREILTLASDGLKRDEIAARLHVSASTVKTHLQHIYQKLEVGGKAAAIKKAQ